MAVQTDVQQYVTQFMSTPITQGAVYVYGAVLPQGEQGSTLWVQKSATLDGKTYIMPGLLAWQQAMYEHASIRASQPDTTDVQYRVAIATERPPEDQEQFVQWLQDPQRGGAPNVHCSFLIIEGPGLRTAHEVYQRLARSHPDKITLLRSSSATDPGQLVGTLLHAIGSA